MTTDPIDWQQIEGTLNEDGFACHQRMLSDQQCDALTAGYEREDAYRKRIVMQRHGYGRGEY
ncbi:MAG: proline hydroxylase, partial [Sneathiella sp.]